MEDKVPLAFSDRSIRQFVDNLFGGELMVLPADYLLMRTVFRHLGGLWESVALGDAKHIGLLNQIVQTWGSNRKNQREIEVT